MSFSVEEDEKIIDFVKNHDCIYNAKSKDYRNSQLKKSLWCEIGRILNRTDVECCKRWVYVRDYYVRRRGKPGIGSSGELAKKRSHLLSFLDDVPSSKRCTISNVECENKKESTHQGESFDEDVAGSAPGSCHDDECCDGGSNVSPHRSSPPQHRDIVDSTEATPARKRKASHSDERLELLKRLADRNTLDEVDHFFISVAKTVKKLPAVEQAKLRMDIANLVGNAELAALTRKSSN